MIKSSKSEPAISQAQLRQIYKQAKEAFRDKNVGARAMEALTETYGHGIIEKAIETETKERTKELMLEYKKSNPAEFETNYGNHTVENLGMLSEWDLPQTVRAGIGDIFSFTCGIEDWELHHSSAMNTIITDPATEQHMKIRDFEKKYQTAEWTDALLKSKIENNGRMPYEIIQAIKAKNTAMERKTGEVPVQQPVSAEQTVVKREKVGSAVDGPSFVKVRHLFIDRLRSSTCHKNPTATLLYLLKHRGFEGKKDTHATGAAWYSKKKLIVASKGQLTMMRELGIDRSTVKRHISKLIENGDIKVEVENRENVYVLGYVEANGQEQFYYQGGHD